MFLDISVKDMINNNVTKVIYNEVVLYRRDIINIPKLMQYLLDQRIFFDQELRLDSLLITKQNEIGIIFLEHYGFIINKDGTQYLNKSKITEIFANINTLQIYLTRSAVTHIVPAENALSLVSFSTIELNEIIINWFSRKYRNYKSVDKFISSSQTLYDVNFNKGYFSKIVNPTEFLELMFSRFIRTTKGSIPFSDDFGSSIKSSLQSKATYFTKKIILEEVLEFTTALTNTYQEDFSLVDINYREDIGLAIKLTIFVTLKANNEQPVTFKLEG